MENPCKLILYGDSIARETAPKLENLLCTDYPEIDLTLINAGVTGETSRDGLLRLQNLVDEKPDVVVIGFGMNDWRKGIARREYKKNLVKMLDEFEAAGTRVIINTLSPSYDFQKRNYNKKVDDYSDAVREISYEKRVKIADINALWKQKYRSPQKGLRDDIHPNSKGYEVMCKSLMWVIPRRNTTVLWQYNGREAKCNYRCPYCYYVGLHNSTDRFTGYIEQWHERFLESFGNQHLIFYLAFGEPTIGGKFFDILNMIGDERNWELRITSNISRNLNEIVKHHLTKEGRVNINASYHPSMTNKVDFLRRLLFLREHGIESSVVYVAYPEYLPYIFDDVKFFSEQGFVVHIRRFQGRYEGRTYPWFYTDQEKQKIAHFSDDGMIKYMLNQQMNKNALTFSGFHFFALDNAGNVGYDSNAFGPYTYLRNIFGNIHTGNFKPSLMPTCYPGMHEGTVDGVANLVSANYKELEGNNVLSFARQGGVYKDESGKIIYSNSDKDFNDPRIRAQYNFPPRNIRDNITLMKDGKVPMIRQLLYDKAYATSKTMVNHSPRLKSFAKRILRK
jgi:lysophospholipase L1-like esterase